GKITKVDDEFIKVLVGEGVELRFQKSSIGASLPKGTIKSLENGK
ncbi:MAG TPA: preprotein translocase subunit YajC, partial [Gammaproteobacteria bacterium]|nr:preprotein translocase subunit YajC [Gammaproteobacteria bacterium]